ncbi:NAD(P)H-dependent oxidoreductase [Acinetobacter baumannii]|jgi:FMN reductase|uniref:NAD(P)H-dependent oxidoreductase n=2 Tax=Acinetobacter TaxID=469 RepID=A0A2N6VEI0_9GAMM|nr:NAD(P)H-dependent oxidoreductase [Acinetobacter baumannii]ENU84898.1 FMN reductase [Acinetobacter sp. CIP 102129]ENV77509.1 FMN reductase [Acinetobacter ursingii DSM 16037 = CIP 107286]KAF6698531.1 NAD(P)H-dependent oxidoreductase [Acinetobacter sp. EKM10A]MCU4321800.1 NAD(P)H-dependent oxidoreductase [Acinetobacter bereziniae]MCU4359455.1 NAD(P)H-dependent oxidoreductase [Acinetobacter ursingii]MCU4415351.1 NAD(P)H-dependent oxidoreductase [Acinetobacter sp. WU_MDCI_Axc73]NAR48529.1 FMN 
MFEHPPTLRLVVVSGGFGMQSKTETLVQTIADEIAKRLSVELEFVKFSEIGGFIGQTFDRKQLPEHVQIALHTVETADALIVGTPVYRASYPGLFKHFFDLIEQFALVNVPVILAASGGSERHSLVIEHQLRPLFSFFQTQTMSLGVYATDKDFSSDYRIINHELLERISLTIQRALPILRAIKLRHFMKN